MIDEYSRINFSISGWPGSGCTTLSLLLSLIFNRKYYYTSKLYQYIQDNIKIKGDMDLSLNIEETIEKTIDQYTDFKLTNDNNLVLDSDITVFRIGKHSKVFSIFLKTSFEVRKERLISINDNDLSLEERESILKEKYKKQFDIDYFDINFIENKHNLVIDNSYISINTEIKTIFETLKNWVAFNTINDDEWEIFLKRMNKYIEIFNKKGKNGLIDELKRKELYLDSKDILLDITSIFPEDISSFPENIKNIFLNLKHEK